MVDFEPFVSAGAIDPFVWTNSRNFGAISASRFHTQYRSYSGDEVEWQEAVYDQALRIQESSPFGKVLDLGCGSGEKSSKRFAGVVDLLQIDRNDFRKDDVKARGIAFESVSFDQWDDFDHLFSSLDAEISYLIICSDVIEHLHDPRPLLNFFLRALRLNSANRVVLSTPDHERLEGTSNPVLPSNKEHVRQWSVFTFGAHLRSAGFDVKRYGLVPMNKYDTLRRTIFAELACEVSEKESFLHSAQLPRASERLLITGEHKRTGRGGGIATYAHHSELVLGSEAISVFFGENGYTGAPNEAKDRQWIHAAIAVAPPGAEAQLRNDASTGDKILDCVSTLTMLYPELRWIEFDDYGGQAYLVPQAKEAGRLPKRISIVCYCHGNHHYLEVNHRRFFHDSEAHARERVCVERADVTLIPSDYLKALYDRAGLVPKKTVKLAYPYQFRFAPHSENDYRRIGRIVFFGKRTFGKGFPLFAEAINALAEEGGLDEVHEIIVSGVGDDDFSFSPKVEDKIVYKVFDNSTIVDEIYSMRLDSIFVLPYLGDNFPFSVHEVIDAGVQALFARAGGVPEVLQDCDPDGSALFDANSRALAAKIRQKLTQTGLMRGLETRALNHRFRNLQAARNVAYLNFDMRQSSSSNLVTTASLPPYDVIITYHNEEPRHLQDALDGLAIQRQRPVNVVIVDDCSRDERRAAIQVVVDQERRLNVKVVRPDQNLGLAAARNFGMEYVNHEYFIAHDVDNVLRSDATEAMLTLLVVNPDAGAATAHNVMFQDHPDWLDSNKYLGLYQPIAPDLGEFHANTFGDALAMYRRSKVQAVGGWRNTGREPLEDFELFYRLQADGSDVLIVPATVLLYRVRQESMLRTYDRFRGYLRIADVITERLGRDGLSVVRNAMKWYDAPQVIDRREEPASYAASSDVNQKLLIELLRTALPPKLRSDDRILYSAISDVSWRKIALRHPWKIRHWQTIRRLQRAARRMDLRTLD